MEFDRFPDVLLHLVECFAGAGAAWKIWYVSSPVLLPLAAAFVDDCVLSHRAYFQPTWRKMGSSVPEGRSLLPEVEIVIKSGFSPGLNCL